MEGDVFSNFHYAQWCRGCRNLRLHENQIRVFFKSSCTIDKMRDWGKRMHWIGVLWNCEPWVWKLHLFPPRDEPNAAIRYLEYCIRQQQNEDSAVHNLLLSLYARQVCFLFKQSGPWRISCYLFLIFQTLVPIVVISWYPLSTIHQLGLLKTLLQAETAWQHKVTCNVGEQTGRRECIASVSWC